MAEPRHPRGGPPAHPRRRPSNAVFWRRRAVLLAVTGLLVFLALTVLKGSGHPVAAGREKTSADGTSGTTSTTVAQQKPIQPVDASLFTAGSCMAEAPTQGDRHLTVFLDAGHGGIDPGAIGTTETGETIHEANETLPVELDAAALLRAQGYRVVVSRTSATTVARLTSADISNDALSTQGVHDDVAARDVCANLARANVLIGIYFDAGAYADNAGSVTAYDDARPFSASNLRLANDVQTDVVAAMNAHGWDIPNEGVVSDTDLGGPALNEAAADYGRLLLLGPAMPGYFTTPSQMPGALIEPLFITDPFEGSIANSTSGQQAIAHGLDQAIQAYFSSPSPGQTDPSAG